MITVTRLNHHRFVVNAELIRSIEQNPDTILTLVTGEHIVVREPMDEVVRRCINYGRLLRRALRPDDLATIGFPPDSPPASPAAPAAFSDSAERDARGVHPPEAG